MSKDTLKIADARGFVRDSPPRHTVWHAQTPQIFERKLLERAHKNHHNALPGTVPTAQYNASLGTVPTDDSQLVERLGVRVKLVESPSENLKVTVPMDFVLARHILKERA